MFNIHLKFLFFSHLYTVGGLKSPKAAFAALVGVTRPCFFQNCFLGLSCPAVVY